MRILLISTSVVPVGAGHYGGIEKMATDLAIGLSRAGHQVTVAAPYGSSMPSPINLINTVKLPDEQDRDDIATVKIYNHGGFSRYEVVLDFSHGHFVGRADPANPDYATHVKKFPMLNMIWDNVTVPYTKACFNIGAVSEWQAERFRDLYHQEAKVVPKWGYVDGRRYKPARTPKRERFLFLGKLTPDKGALEAIDLARRVGVGLDVVGGLLATDDRTYADRLRALSDGKDIRFYFNASEDHKIQLLQNAKAVIYPVQFDEAHNLVAIEAAATHTPMVAYRRGGLGGMDLAHIVDAEEEFVEAMKTVDKWFVPTKEDWTVEGRIPTYEAFFHEIAGGLRW